MIEQHGTLEISASRVRHNVETIRGRLGKGTALCATIKADAYSHGLPQMAPLLIDAGIQWAATYSLAEALVLAGWEFNVLALAPLVLAPGKDFLSREALGEMVEKRIRLNVTDLDSALRLSFLADQFLRGARLPIHVQVDTGLTRIGVAPGEAAALARQIGKFPGLRLEGLFSHFSHGDVPGDSTVPAQLSILRNIAAALREEHPKLMVHMQNSGGAAHLGDAGLDMVRIGIALYGLQPSTANPIANLLPVARVTAPVLAIHERPAGTGVGYGHTFCTKRESRLAVVPVGYADGYPRQLSNRGVAQVREREVQVVGRVSMDQIILDVTDVPGVCPGDRVTVISWNPGAANGLDRMADAIGTIGYELATHLGPRLCRTVVS